jgi:uncharacterized protein YbcI
MTEQSTSTPTSGHPTPAVAARISTAIVRLVSEYTGRGPTKARTTLNTNFALVVLEDTLTKGERRLIAAGEIEIVHSQREAFQKVMRAEATAAVERISGRDVRVSLSNFSPQDGLAVELYLFVPLPETGAAVVADAQAHDAEE